MNAGGSLMSYPEERALEDVAYRLRARPTRIFAILYPVLSVEIKAEVVDGAPYELIDRHLERAIAYGGLRSTEELAAFLSLNSVLVDRALRFLTAIGHVVHDGRGLGLTPLGMRSVQENRRYEVTLQDRRKLYFDAFGSRPLPRACYDERLVSLLPFDALAGVESRRSGPRFQPIHYAGDLRPQAVDELARLSDRDAYNLPAEIHRPEIVAAPEKRYLPMFVVRALEGANVRHFAYTQADDEADQVMTGLCERTGDIFETLEHEEHFIGSDQDDGWASGWLRRRGFTDLRLARGRSAIWRYTAQARAFDRGGAFSLTKLGSFVVIGNSFFQVWCADERTRRRALLERMDLYLSARAKPKRSDVESRVARISLQLELDQVDVPRLAEMARRAGRSGLATQLDQLD
jgi:hypothetical protein